MAKNNTKARTEDEIWEGEQIQYLIQEYHNEFGSWKATAEYVGVSPQYLSAAARGKTGTGPKICKGLEIERTWLYKRIK